MCCTLKVVARVENFKRSPSTNFKMLNAKMKGIEEKFISYTYLHRTDRSYCTALFGDHRHHRPATGRMLIYLQSPLRRRLHGELWGGVIERLEYEYSIVGGTNA